MKALSDQELIAKLALGENLALNELMGRYKQRLFYFIRRYVGDEETAYDILQETFTKLYFNAGSYKPRYKFSTWLFQIALNLCRDHSRKQGKKFMLSLDSRDNNGVTLGDTLAADTGDIGSHLDAKQQLAILEHEIQKLPHKLKSALIAFVIDERSQEECADLLDITPKALEARVYRARKILAGKLAAMPGSYPDKGMASARKQAVGS
jgi:RNA polymerase sigma-70 factor (ECF subfamily)